MNLAFLDTLQESEEDQKDISLQELVERVSDLSHVVWKLHEMMMFLTNEVRALNNNATAVKKKILFFIVNLYS